MEQQIQSLIDTIKKEGLEEAEKEKERIIAEAKAKAAKIVSDAEEMKERLLQEADKKIKIDENTKNAQIAQAARNASIQLKSEIEKEFKRILSVEVKEALTSDNLVKIIQEVIKAESNGKSVYVELSEKDFKALYSTLTKTFEKEIKNGLEFKVSPSVTSGFRVSEKDGSYYVDLSDDECVSLIFPYLSESLRELL